MQNRSGTICGVRSIVAIKGHAAIALGLDGLAEQRWRLSRLWHAGGGSCRLITSSKQKGMKMSDSPKSLLAGLMYLAFKVFCSVVVVVIYPQPAVMLAVCLFWIWQLVAPYRRDLADFKASLKRGESVNPLWLRLTNLGPKVGFSVMACVVYPMIGIPAVVIFWIVDLTFLSRRRAAARAAGTVENGRQG